MYVSYKILNRSISLPYVIFYYLFFLSCKGRTYNNNKKALYRAVVSCPNLFFFVLLYQFALRPTSESFRPRALLRHGNRFSHERCVSGGRYARTYVRGKLERKDKGLPSQQRTFLFPFPPPPSLQTRFPDCPSLFPLMASPSSLRGAAVPKVSLLCCIRFSSPELCILPFRQRWTAADCCLTLGGSFGRDYDVEKISELEFVASPPLTFFFSLFLTSLSFLLSRRVCACKRWRRDASSGVSVHLSYYVHSRIRARLYPRMDRDLPS